MECRITIFSPGCRKQVSVPSGSNLLEIIQQGGFTLYTPCGGQGTCGKCKVLVEGEGTVTACSYTVNKDLGIHIPDHREMEVMVSQHQLTWELPLNPLVSFKKHASPMGVAVDIGTTTLAFYLVSLDSGKLLSVRTAINPQTMFGSDVISRINYCMNNSKRLESLRKSILDGISSELRGFIRQGFLERGKLTGITVAGNNTMLHILAGIDPTPLALAPFTPAFTERRILAGVDTGLPMHPEGEIHLLPSVSAYVGADIVAGIASLNLDEQVYLYIDIGTNGEIAVITPEKIWCCATAAGPAFEGANISCGTGAFSGAISRFGRKGFSTIADAAPTGICGSGLIDVIANLLDEGLVAPDGRLSDPFLVSPAHQNAINSDIVITQEDVREIQLAKGAIAAGISILMKYTGLEFSKINGLLLAGGFGNYLDVASAIRIGLIPAGMTGKVIQVGNAAGNGALLALKSEDFLLKLDQLPSRAEYVELSFNEDFPEEFAMKMNFE